MSITVLTNGKGANSFTAGATIFQPFSHSFFGNVAANTETNVQVPYFQAGTITQLGCRVVTNDRTIASTLRLRKNATNGNNNLSITALTTGNFRDASSSDTVASGDLINTQLVVGTGGTSLVIEVFDALFNPNNTGIGVSVPTSNNSTGTNLTAASTTSFLGPSGQMRYNATESNAAYKMRTSGTLRQLFATVITNGSSAATTINSRKNSGAGSQSISVSAAATGIFKDTTNTDTIAVGDTINYSVVTGAGTVSFLTGVIGSHFQTNDGTVFHACVDSNQITYTAATTTYVAIAVNAPSTAEVDTTRASLNSRYISKLMANVGTNTITATSTINSRKNSANGSLVLSIPSSTTGVFEDLTNVDSYGLTDTAGIAVTAGSTGTSLRLLMFGVVSQEVRANQQFYSGGF